MDTQGVDLLHVN